MRDLQKYYETRRSLIFRNREPVRAVDGITFSIRRGETLGLVGESGCGKTTVGRMIVRLLKPTDGAIQLSGQDITWLPEKQLRPLRRHIQMIFQDPYLSLSPQVSAGGIISEPLENYDTMDRADMGARASALLERVA